MNTIDITAWLENATGERIPLEGLCSLGRDPASRIHIHSAKASRRHAVIRANDRGQLQITDLGSSNGTYVNQRRVAHQTALHDGDIIEIGGQAFGLHAPGLPPSDGAAAAPPGATVTEGWLFLTGTAACARVTSNLDELSPKTEAGWELDCTRAMETHRARRGSHRLCDLLFYWEVREKFDPAAVRRALLDFERIRARQRPHLSVVLHYGPLVLSRAPRTSSVSLTGLTIAFAVQMLKQASETSRRCLISEAAREHFDQPGLLRPLETRTLPGFPGEHSFYSF